MNWLHCKSDHIMYMYVGRSIMDVEILPMPQFLFFFWAGLVSNCTSRLSGSREACVVSWRHLAAPTLCTPQCMQYVCDVCCEGCVLLVEYFYSGLEI